MSLLWLITAICFASCTYAGYRLGRYVERRSKK
jgi:hypothetical protein